MRLIFFCLISVHQSLPFEFFRVNKALVEKAARAEVKGPD